MGVSSGPRSVWGLAAVALCTSLLGCSADGAGNPSAPAPVDRAEPHPQTEAASSATGAAPAERAPWTLPAEPQRTRAGQLRFADEELHDNPEAATMILERLAIEPRAEVRAALVEALPRTGGQWLAAIEERFTTEPAAAVRVAMAAIAPRAAGGTGGALLSLALGDREASVRTEAAHASASLGAAAALEAKLDGRLQALLADAESRPRAAAARSLGVLGIGQSFPSIRSLLRDADAEVRLQALRALERLAPDRAAGLAELAALERDADARVSRLASRLRAKQAP
jgi:HEAT repeat protein